MKPSRIFLLFALCAAATSAKAQPQPNVLLIVADDLGLQLSCYGDKYIHTPHIDALSASGTRFRTAYVAQASCSPSRASIFTGLFPHTHGHIGLAKRGNPPLLEEFRDQTLPALLKRAGYRTGIIGKLHVNPKSALPFDLSRNADLGPNGAREIRAMAEAAGEFIAADRAKPFFLMMSYVDPHHPFAAQMDGLPEKPTLPGEVPPWPFQLVEDETTRKEAANYYNCVRRLDAGVGLLMEKLKASGADENTLIIFLGDHGPPFARAKTTCYEAGLRVPFLLRWPGVTQPGLVSDAFVSSVDILPTILDATGINIPAHVQGRSLRKVGAGDVTGWRSTLAGEYHQHGERPFFPRRALRDARFQVIHNLLAGKATTYPSVDGDTADKVALTAAYEGTPARKAMELLPDPPKWELYDLEADPGQFQNLAADPAHTKTLQRMQGLLHDWQMETQDPFLDPTALARKHAEVNE
jgi:N-sulfoglucosamine sulfohydrolase